MGTSSESEAAAALREAIVRLNELQHRVLQLERQLRQAQDMLGLVSVAGNS